MCVTRELFLNDNFNGKKFFKKRYCDLNEYRKLKTDPKIEDTLMEEILKRGFRLTYFQSRDATDTDRDDICDRKLGPVYNHRTNLRPLTSPPYLSNLDLIRIPSEFDSRKSLGLNSVLICPHFTHSKLSPNRFN